MKFVLALCILCGVVETVLCGTGVDAQALREKLFVTDGYDKKIRPITNQSLPISVSVNFYLLSINELDEVTETMKATGYLWLLWQDDYLVWDPSSYGGIRHYHWPQNDIWKPDVALKNSYRPYEQLGEETLNIFVNYGGSVEWYPLEVFHSTCSMDITYYPYDIQICEMEFAAWSYTKDEVIVNSSSKGIDLFNYGESSAWKILDTSFRTKEDSYDASIIFTLKIQRKPLYIILSVIFPISMLAVLNLSVFVLPSDCGEKASYTITVFLAFAVFLSIVSSTLPENSEKVGHFSKYLIFLTVQSTLITLCALILVRVSSLQTTVPGKILTFVNFLSFQKCCFYRNKDKVENLDREITNADKTDTKDDVSQTGDSHSTLDRTWKDVANSLDKICFVVFILSLGISTLVFFVSTSSNS